MSEYQSWLKVEAFGKTYISFSACCQAHNIDRATVQSRMKRNWTLEEALKPVEREPIKTSREFLLKMKDNPLTWQWL